jgi:hypothetical protein
MSPNRTNSPPARPDPVLAEHAAEIRKLGKQTVENVIEIGRRLTECKKLVGHGAWLPWLDREFGWSKDTAERFIQIAAFSNQIPQVAEFNLPISGLYLLAAPSTPKEAVDEIVERAQRGEPVPVAEVKRVVDTAKGKQPAKKSRREVYPKEQAAASTTTTFEVAAELKGLVAKAPGWTGAIAGTQAEVNAAEGRLRDDGAAGHWLIAAPRERLVVDYRIVSWLLLTAPPPPAVTHIEWAFCLCDAAEKARCPTWVSERLTGKSRPQRPGMIWPRELPIPREMPRDDVGADSQAEAERLRVRVEELQVDKRRLELKVAGLERELEDLRGKLATETGGDKSIGEFQVAIKKWEDTVETQRGIIARLEKENTQLRAEAAAPPADDGLDIPECLRRSVS